MALRLFLLLITAALGVRGAQIYRRFEVAERSMEPTLRGGDYLITSRIIDRLGRGDLVVYEHPAQPGFWLVKRVIGLPGDEIAITDDRLLRDGSAVDHRPTPGEGRWVVPPGRIFVIGDNRRASTTDSRSLGPIPIGLVEGRVVWRYWPVTGWGRVR